jgi:hypothetical protein
MADLHKQVFIRHYAGMLQSDGDARLLGRALAFSDLPRRETRRLSVFEKSVIACILGLGDDASGAAIVMGSQYGTLSTNTLDMLKGLLSDIPVSPTKFSLSVHNASVGLATQLSGNRMGYTAVAAGPSSLDAAITESLARLADGADKIVLSYSDCRLTHEYEPFNKLACDVHIACCLERAADAESTPLSQLISGNGPTRGQDFLERLHLSQEGVRA